MTSDYQPWGNWVDCWYYISEPEKCWGEVEFVDSIPADYDEASDTWSEELPIGLCRGHQHMWPVGKGPYVPKPEVGPSTPH